MAEKKIYDMEDIMADYAEMPGFDFNSLNYRQMQELQRVTDSEYSNVPYAFKYGKFDLVDLFHSFITQRD